MASLEVAELGLRELPGGAVAVTAKWRQDEPDVVAGVELIDDGAGEPIET
jgi:hypothetical protein